MHNVRIEQTAGALVLSCVVAVFLASHVASAQDACRNLEARPSASGTTIDSVTAVPANTQSRLPGFCEVHATISPVKGSHIGAVYRLPANWNGKILGIGGGGFAGNLRFRRLRLVWHAATR